MEDKELENHETEVEPIKDLNKKAIIQLFDIDKVYPNGVQAVFGFTLDIFPHEFVVLVGPSGCGKSTTLRMIAGLEEITYGQLYINQKLSNFVESKDRDIAMVFQNYALYPNMTVYENMAFGLKIRKTPKEEIDKRVFEAAKILDLGKYLDRKPKELSGGQMQRVALGRAIVRQAPIFLMDEPLSNLDAKLRVSMRSEIVRIHNTVGSTTIYVTHDQIEAMTMASKIVVMNKGFVQQIGKPNDIYTRPCNSFVATFIGTPAMNTFTAKYESGKVIIDQGVLINNTNLKKVHDDFLNEKVNEIEPLLVDFGFEGASYLRRMISNRITLQKEEIKDLNKKKESIFAKISKLFKKKDKNINNEETVSKEAINESKTDIIEEVNPLKEELIENLNLIKDEQKNPHDILVGIRPEKIILKKVTDETNAKIVVTADIVELLGADYNVYFNLQGTNIVAKVNNTDTISVGDKFEVILNEKDIYLFDYVTGSRIEF